LRGEAEANQERDSSLHSEQAPQSRLFVKIAAHLSGARNDRHNIRIYFLSLDSGF
jgi:hypothetical protein